MVSAVASFVVTTAAMRMSSPPARTGGDDGVGKSSHRKNESVGGGYCTVTVNGLSAWLPLLSLVTTVMVSVALLQ